MSIIDAYRKFWSEFLNGIDEKDNEMEWYQVFAATRGWVNGVERYINGEPIDGLRSEFDIEGVLQMARFRNPCKPHQIIRAERCTNNKQREAAEMAHSRRSGDIAWFEFEMETMEAKFI